jgi:hypothetical protein
MSRKGMKTIEDEEKKTKENQYKYGNRHRTIMLARWLLTAVDL